MQIEGTTHSSVSDDRLEDVRAVDLLPLPLALPQHVRGGGDLRGGERVAGQGWLPQQAEDVGDRFGKLLLGNTFLNMSLEKGSAFFTP